MSSNTTVHHLLAAQATNVSSAIFVYDSTPTDPFGSQLNSSSHAQLFKMETRPGAGSSLVGFVESLAFSSKGAQVNEVEAEEEVETASVPAKRATRSRTISTKKAKTTQPAAAKAVSIIGSTASFKALVPALLSLPSGGVRPPLSIHISAQTSSVVNDSFVQVPDLESFFEGLQALSTGGFETAVVLSETAEQAAFVGTGLAATVNAAGHDLVNVFDGLTAGRQLSSLKASSSSHAGKEETLLATLAASEVPFFSLSGSPEASHIIVVPASTYSASAKAAQAALAHPDVAILSVRIVKPWSAHAFVSILPRSAKTLHVFAFEGQKTSIFHDQVISTLLESPGFRLKVRSLPVPTSASVPSVEEWVITLTSIAPLPSSALKSLLPEQAKLAVFWSLDNSTAETEVVPAKLASAFADSATGVAAKLLTSFDNFNQGGLQQDLLLLEAIASGTTDSSVEAIAATTPASLLFISSPAAVFKAYEPISSTSVGSTTNVVISANWTAEEVATKLPLSARQTLVENKPSSFFLIDADKVAAANGVQPSQIAELVFWSLYLPALISPKELVGLLANTPSFASWDHAKLVEINSVVRNSLVKVEIDSAWIDTPMAVAGEAASAPAPSLPTKLVPTAAGPNLDRHFADPIARIVGSSKSSWHGVAQRLMYPEAFARVQDAEQQLRPDLPEKNYLVTVSETRRLTPNTYDRNVFHIEFDLAGTGLKYAVGEALGIHGWNDAEEVSKFIEWYGLDPEAVISIPAHNDPEGRLEQRTIFQVFQQNLDIFGKPGKSFYETLSKYASNKEQERALRFIAAPEGSATFKKMSEVDTLTYADVMQLFPSARPSIEDLVREIDEIKPRHYSIASSQNFVGDSVHLLIVTVEWNDSKGELFLIFSFCPSAD